ncbi:hypothetical protein EGR_10211 [Echinococcus granulosus]|uniref:Uncharacterized protein n=1 Tax=Echinococcus granulosus TaxID=6210 RepID=W6UN09_ECHGR|nr:hypothetical protein EGR_10211 [Echinococcus granulosus]EUB54929.1 hypothetical protein EGR_10211 [Echinococcus granulosus]
MVGGERTTHYLYFNPTFLTHYLSKYLQCIVFHTPSRTTFKSIGDQSFSVSVKMTPRNTFSCPARVFFIPIARILCASELSNSTLLKNVIHFNVRREKKDCVHICNAEMGLKCQNTKECVSLLKVGLNFMCFQSKNQVNLQAGSEREMLESTGKTMKKTHKLHCLILYRKGFVDYAFRKLQANSANFALNRLLNALQYTGYLYQNNVGATAVLNGTSTGPQNDADQIYASGYKLLFNCIADGGDGSWQRIYSHL